MLVQRTGDRNYLLADPSYEAANAWERCASIVGAPSDARRRACDALVAGLAHDPDSIQERYRLARLLLADTRYEDARRELDRCLERRADDPAWQGTPGGRAGALAYRDECTRALRK
jgi:thioredoxin-like negative regulator of GroEL